jgi:membrane fusion protein, multidrug efflux system
VPQAEAASRSFLVKLRLPRREDLYEGMFGRVMIPAGERRHVCLHTGAVESVGQLEYVDVVRLDGTIERRLIRTGRLGYENHVEVLSGLKPGERVLLHGEAAERCKAGQPTEPSPGREGESGDER